MNGRLGSTHCTSAVGQRVGRRFGPGRSRICISSFLGWKEGRCSLVRILVVDDNPAVRHYLRALLEQQSAWQVCDEARTGREALQRVEKNPPDMILLDFQMPDLNGLDVAREVTRLFPEIPDSDDHNSSIQATGGGGPQGRHPWGLREIRCGFDRRSRRSAAACWNLFPITRLDRAARIPLATENTGFSVFEPR